MDGPAILRERLARGEWLTPGEVAALLDVGRSTVHLWLSSDPPKIRYRTKPFGTWRECNPDDVRRLLAERDAAGH